MPFCTIIFYKYWPLMSCFKITSYKLPIDRLEDIWKIGRFNDLLNIHTTTLMCFS